MPTPEPEWRTEVARLAAGDAWVMDGNYGGTLDLRLARCDAVVFLALPRVLCAARVLRRWLRYAGRPSRGSSARSRASPPVTPVPNTPPHATPRVVVRAATPGDADAISALTAAVQALHAAARPDVFRHAGPDTFPAAHVRALMADPDRLFLVAEIVDNATGAGHDRGRVVGHAYAEVQRQPATPFKHAAARLYVHQMAVAAAHRGRGVGARLLDAVQALAGERGVGAVALDVHGFNADARRFYERAGFVAERIVLARDVKPGATGLRGGDAGDARP